MSLNDDALQSLALSLLSDYDAVTPGEIFKGGLRLSIPDAYRLQTAVTRFRESRGDTVCGYKIGAVDPGNQRMLGLTHPVWGRIWKNENHRNGAVLKTGDYTNLSLEAEFGVTFTQDLHSGMQFTEICDAVSHIYPLLELHNLHFGGERPYAHELIATNCINCGVVTGAAVAPSHNIVTTDLKLLYDKAEVDAWEGLSWPQDLIGAVPTLIAALAEHNLTLRAGEIALTGAWGPPIPVENAKHVEVTSSAFGAAFATLI